MLNLVSADASSQTRVPEPWPSPGAFRTSWERCYSWGEDMSKVLSWLGRLLCIVGLHDFRLIDVSLTFGTGGEVKKLECQRCGVTKTQRA